ncbi:MAG: sigma-70 family RNA polymerase sigma factor [Planctomycetota bacterium]
MNRLAERLAQGDSSAFADLYDACADQLHHYLTTRLGSREDASDVLQEAFVRMARSRERFAGVEDPVAYAFVVARNESARHRQQAARTPVARQASAEMLFAEARSDELERRELAEFVAAALARLEDGLRDIVHLKIYAGLTFAKIAEVMELPQGTVATRYRRAIQLLRTEFAKELM